jgi:diketogulonate reductase-like aldo/keto reductase
MSHDSKVALPTGETVPALGQGTWRMGERRELRQDEVAALRLGLDLGMTLIDTAEMYGDGGAEEVVGEAIAGRREEVFLVSKVYPHNAGGRRLVEACEASLRRLRTDRLDCYLLHWRGSVPLAETVEGFEALRRAGKIRTWGVSNFDTPDMKELAAIAGADACVTNQILYNVSRRGPEFDLLPFMAERRMPAMAYSPVEQGRLPRSGTMTTIARKHGASPYQVALAWVMRRGDVVAIPKAAQTSHLRDNHGSLAVKLDAEDLLAMDAQFEPPSRKRPLEMI